MSGNNRQVAAALVELSADVVLCTEVHENNVVLRVFNGEVLDLGDRGFLNRLGDDKALELIEDLVGHLGCVLNTAVHNAVFADDSGERAGVKAADTRNALLF